MKHAGLEYSSYRILPIRADNVRDNRSLGLVATSLSGQRFDFVIRFFPTLEGAGEFAAHIAKHGYVISFDIPCPQMLGTDVSSGSISVNTSKDDTTTTISSGQRNNNTKIPAGRLITFGSDKKLYSVQSYNNSNGNLEIYPAFRLTQSNATINFNPNANVFYHSDTNLELAQDPSSLLTAPIIKFRENV